MALMNCSAPPWNGAKPQPKMLPMLASATERSTPSSKQRAASLACANIRRSISSRCARLFAPPAGTARASPGHKRLSLVGVVVEALARLLADAADLAQLAHHGHARVLGVRPCPRPPGPSSSGRPHAGQATATPRPAAPAAASACRPAGPATSMLRGCTPSGQHRDAFHHVGAEDAAGVEAAAVVDDDRRLADLQHEVEAARQRLVAGVLADDDLHQRHLVHRAEEVQADEVAPAARWPAPGR